MVKPSAGHLAYSARKPSKTTGTTAIVGIAALQIRDIVVYLIAVLPNLKDCYGHEKSYPGDRLEVKEKAIPFQKVGIDRRNPAPLHKQIKERLLDDMRRGLIDGDPSEFYDSTLMERFGVSRITVRAAINELVEEGILRRVRGRGTFVVKPPPVAPILVLNDGPFYQEWHLPGFDPRCRILEFRRTKAPAPVAARLKLSTGDAVLLVRRLRLREKKPAVFDVRYVAGWCSIGITRKAMGHNMIFPLIERLHGIACVEVEEELGAGVADPAEAQLLQIPGGSALIRRELTYFDEFGRPLITGVSVYPLGSARFKMQVRRR